LYRDRDRALAHRYGKYCAIPACYRDNSLPTNWTVSRIAALVTQTTTTAVPLDLMLRIVQKCPKSTTYNMKINFMCENCLNIYDVDMKSIQFDKTRELVFTPEPECPRCGATEEVVLSNFGLEQIDHLIFSNQIKTIK
jgi:hypothetical protein